MKVDLNLSAFPPELKSLSLLLNKAILKSFINWLKVVVRAQCYPKLASLFVQHSRLAVKGWPV